MLQLHFILTKTNHPPKKFTIFFLYTNEKFIAFFICTNKKFNNTCGYRSERNPKPNGFRSGFGCEIGLNLLLIDLDELKKNNVYCSV